MPKILSLLLALTFPILMFGQIVDIPPDKLGEIEDYQKLIKQQKQEGNISGVITYTNKIAYIYWDYSHAEEAIKYYEKLIKLNTKINNYVAIAKVNNNLGILYNEVGEYQKSIDHFKNFYKYAKSENNNVKIVETLINIATAQKRLKKYLEAVETLLEALNIAQSSNFPQSISHCYGELSNLYNTMGEKKEAEEYYNLYRDFQKILYVNLKQDAENERLKRENMENLKEIEALKRRKAEERVFEMQDTVKYVNQSHKKLADSLSKSQLALELMTQKEHLKEIKNRDLKREKYAVMLMLSVLLILVVVILSNLVKKARNNKVLAKKNEKIEKQKTIIEQKHKQITDSIEYARKIQIALTNQHKTFTTYIPDSFIWTQPRDIVGGDFLWYTKLGKKLIIAVSDCTGHGVPGGFLTMIGYNFLDQIIKDQKVTTPGEILQELDNKFVKALHQNSIENMDGMDISILLLDYENRKLQFAGANSHLVIIENKKIIPLTSSLFSIGGGYETQFKKIKKQFKTQEINMPKEFSFYMHTDGIQDQFDKTDKERFRKTRIYDIFLKNNDLPANKQMEILQEEFKKWKGKTKQIDDILVIGGKIKDFKINC